MALTKADFLAQLEEGQFNLEEKFYDLTQYEADEAYLVYLDLLKANIDEIITDSVPIYIEKAFEMLTNRLLAKEILDYLLSKNILLSNGTSIRYYYAINYLKKNDGFTDYQDFYEWVDQIKQAFEDDNDASYLLEIGVRYYQLNDKEKALPYFEKAAENKCAESMEFLSLYHQNGLAGLPVDVYKAAQWNIKKGLKVNRFYGLVYTHEVPETYERFGYCSLADFTAYLIEVTPEQRIELMMQLNEIEAANKAQ